MSRAEFPSQESNRGGMIALIFGEHSHLKGMKGDVCFFTLLHYPLWRPHFFFYPNDLLTQFSILPWQEIKKKKIFFLKIFIIFSRIFKKIFVFSRFFPYKMGNYQRIFDFSIGEALYRSLPYILKKSWKNI